MVLGQGQIRFLRQKWSSLSEYMKEIKQGFSRFYNRKHHRKGFFWSERNKNVIVDNGENLINFLAYIDRNPVRAGVVKDLKITVGALWDTTSSKKTVEGCCPWISALRSSV